MSAFMKLLIYCPSIQAVRITADALNGGDGTIQLMAQLRHTLISLIPKSEGDLAQFTKTLEKACIDFESKMAALGWISPISPPPSAPLVSEDGGSVSAASNFNLNGPLTSIVSDMTSKFADARFDLQHLYGCCSTYISISAICMAIFCRRTEILSRARASVLADYHNAMTTACGDASEDDPASAGKRIYCV
jgi:hypothetical protein